MKPFFLELFEYNHFVNQILAERLIAQPSLPEKSFTLFHHILNAHHIWNARVNGGTPGFKVWDGHAPSDLKYIDRSNFEISGLILNNIPFDKPVTYTTLKGQTFTNTCRDILFHVINHSTHHRAQIASLFREAGAEPLVSDYIQYKR